MKLLALLLILINYGCYGSSHQELDALINQDLLADPYQADHANCINPICDIFPQGGCPQGYMCTIVEGMGRICAVEGTGSDGSPCTLLECASGYLCDNGICRRACNDDEDCVQTGACYRPFEGDGQKMCNVRCNIVTVEGCPATYRCDARVLDDYAYVFTDCNPFVSEGMSGDECEWVGGLESPSKDCAPGYGCFNAFPIGACNKFCRHPKEMSPDCTGIFWDGEQTPCCGESFWEIDGIEYGNYRYSTPDGTCDWW